MLGRPKPTAESVAATDRLKAWTRRRFDLAEDTAVLVAEVRCGQPGCPPLETVVAFWSAPEVRHQFKFFKPIQDVTEEELPPSWMKPAMIVDDEDISCC